MREMKDSGIEWVGMIPHEWNTSKIKYIAEFAPRCSVEQLKPDSVVGYAPMECIKKGFFTERTAIYDTIPTSLTPFENGDIVIAKVTPCFENGNIAIMENLQSGIGFGSSELFVLRPKTINTKYLFYWLQNDGFIKKATSTMTGMGGLKRVSPKFVQDSFTCSPTVAEQKRIADFLDGKCAEIDGLVADIQSQIDTLEQYKRSVITETVTKGLNPDVQMKDSRIEWVGMIPAHWRVLRIKNMFSIVSGATPSPDIQNWDGDIRWITPADYKTRDKYVAQGKRNLSSEGFNTCSTSIIPRGSIIFSKRAPIGTVAINTEELCTNQGCLSCIPITDCSCEFFYYVMSVGTEYFELLGTGTTFKEISASNFANCKLPTPPFSEQVEIAHYLSEKVSEIDTIIDQKKEQLTVLENYKKSLIYEYVTGKKEVPAL